MRITAILTIVLAFMALSALAGINDSPQVFVSYAYADDSNQGVAKNQVDDDDQSLIDILRSAGEEEIEESGQGDEESGEEEVAPESEEEEQTSPDESKAPEDQTVVSEEESEELPAIPPEINDADWDDIPGDKVPFFFLIDSSVNGIMDKEEPNIARLKALKYADQIYNGIPFRYEISSATAYLAETMKSVPDLVHMTERTEYFGVVRFDYEAAFEKGSLDRQREGRTVIASAYVRNENIATAFEESRKKAFTEAIRMEYSHEKSLVPANTDVLTGVITGWDVVNEGWLREENRFFLQMRVWVKFDY
jgi:hypothetical protein